jgi:hypothetical protein
MSTSIFDSARFGDRYHAFLGQRVLLRLDGMASSTASVLRRLGVLQTDAGGDLVALSETAATTERAALIDSGYVTYDAARQMVGFTLPILAQWFAAQALELAELRVRDFAGDDLRLENWRDVFMLRVATSSDDGVDALFRELVSVSAGFASSLAQRNIPRWFAQRNEPRPSPQYYAKRLRDAMATWLEALGPLASTSPYADEKGVYALGARIDGDARLTAAWRTDRSAEIFELDESYSPLSPPPGYTASWYQRFVDLRPAWNWMSSARELRAFLERVFDWREYTTARGATVEGRQITFGGMLHQHELAWQAALGALGYGSLATEPIPIQKIVECGVLQNDVVISGARYLAIAPLKAVITRLVSQGAGFLEPPWPVPEVSGGSWVWSGYSETGFLKRVQIVHEGALELYRHLVHSAFGHFADRMSLFASMPLDFRINIFEATDSHAPPSGEWWVTPLRVGPNTVTVLRTVPIITSEQRRKMVNAAKRARPTLQIYGDHGGGGVLNVFGDLPISELAYHWLKADIEELFGK